MAVLVLLRKITKLPNYYIIKEQQIDVLMLAKLLCFSCCKIYQMYGRYDQKYDRWLRSV